MGFHVSATIFIIATLLGSIQTGGCIPVSHDSLKGEIAGLPNDGPEAPRFPAWSLPSFPQPGAPLLQDIPFQINIVFVGVPESLVDESILRGQLLEWYAPIDRMKYYATGNLIPYVNFTLNYEISFMDSTFANDYAQFVLDNHREDFAPYWIQQFNFTNRAWYVGAEEAEQWFATNAPSSILNSGYTVFIVDTFHTTPWIDQYYFYNGSAADHDLGWDPMQYSSQYMIAYGGHHRFLFLDLNAGPTAYDDLYDQITPIWVYDPLNYFHVESFSKSVGFYVRTATELRFTPSWVYAPKYYPSYHVQLTIFSNESFNYLDHIDLEELLNQYQALHPYSEFGVEATQVDLADYPELYDVVQQAYDPSMGDVDPDPIEAYFLSHLDEYVLPHDNDKVLPIFCLAGDFDFSSYRAKSCGDEYGNFVFVLQYVNQRRIGLQWGRTVWFEASGWLWSKWGVAIPIYWLLESSHGNFLNLTVRVIHGKVDFHVLDLFNFNKLMNGEAWQPITSRYGWSFGLHQDTFSPPYVNGLYYLLFIDPYNYDARLDINVSIWGRGGFGLTSLNVHEGGHSFCLSHPHDGFTWHYDDEGFGEYAFWLWDFTSTPMTFAASNRVFDQLDFDSVYRGITVDVLNETFNILEMVDSDLKSFGFGTVPPDVMGNFTSSVQLSNLAIDSFSGSSLPDYGTSFLYAYQALESAHLAYSAFEASFLDISCRVEDANGNPLLDATVDVTYPNGTSLTLHTNASGYLTLSGVPWGDYSYTVYWRGSKVSEKVYSETASVERVIQAEVYSLLLSLKDSDGNALMVQPSQVTLVAPNGTTLTISTYLIAQAQKGTWSVTSVVYEGTEVIPTPNPSISLSGNHEWTIRCKVYSLLLSLEDSDGNSLLVPPSQITLVAPNGTTLTINKYLISQAQVGEWTVTSIVYQDSEVIPETTISTSLSSNYEWTIRCKVHSLTVEIKDFFGLPISGGWVGLYKDDTLLRTETTDGAGRAVFSQISEGNYKIEVSHIQTSTEIVSLTSSMIKGVTMISYVVIGVIGVGIGAPVAVAIILVRRRRRAPIAPPTRPPPQPTPPPPEAIEEVKKEEVKKPPPPPRPPPKAVKEVKKEEFELLKLRLAKGEITLEEYERLRKLLEE